MHFPHFFTVPKGFAWCMHDFNRLNARGNGKMQAISSQQCQLMMRKMFTNHFVNNEEGLKGAGSRSQDPSSFSSRIGPIICPHFLHSSVGWSGHEKVISVCVCSQVSLCVWHKWPFNMPRKGWGRGAEGWKGTRVRGAGHELKPKP